MIDKSELTQEEKTELRRIALEKRKQQLEKEIAEVEKQNNELKDYKKVNYKIKEYFQ